MMAKAATTPLAWPRLQGNPFATTTQHESPTRFSGRRKPWPAPFYGPQFGDSFTRLSAAQAGMSGMLETTIELKNFINSPKHSESNARKLFQEATRPKGTVEDTQQAHARALLQRARTLSTTEKLQLVEMLSGGESSPASILARKALLLHQPISVSDLSNALRHGNRPLAGSGSSLMSAMAISLLALPVVSPAAVLSPAWLHKALFQISAMAL